MTVAQIITQIQDNYSTDFDIAASLGNSPSNSQFLTYINWAIRLISRQIHQLKVSMPISLTANVNEYDLNAGTFVSSSNASQITKIHRVYINNSPLRTASFKQYGMWSLNELEQIYPGWRSTSASTPFLATQVSNKLILYPKPSAADVTNGNCYLCCEYLPAELTGTSDVPDLPIELHEAVAYLAAIKMALPNLSEQESLQRMNLYSQAIASAVEDVKKQNLATIAVWGTLFGTKTYKYMRV